MSALNAIVHRIAVLLVGQPPPRVPPGTRHAPRDRRVEEWPAFIPKRNPLERQSAAAQRGEDAMTMMDPDCYGYLLLTVHRAPEGAGARADIRMTTQMEDSWWPAVGNTLERIADEAK
jgi:hypothetical protein